MSFFQNKPPKQRFWLMCIAFAVLAVFAYSLSIHKTIMAYSTYQANNKALTEASTAPAQIQRFQAKLNQFNQSFQRIDYDREQLFEAVNTYCREHNLSLSKFHPEERTIQNDFEIITNQIEVQGAYKDMVKLVYELEYVQQLGHVASTKFDKIVNRRTKEEVLTAEIYLQNINPAKLTSND